ncbi:hypothetical protein NPX13_g242 [Xylaria arbuscula]|uniref:Cytochrome c oxidase assembly protein COX16, mitochondrial n=1 Tax=Xylaria arbuscula TaxID=114810 RepID=A0A9W8TS65_9PEZI|nr:hypothetical protein NPX13_g242 [Xylaria arbuscula]
MGGGRHIVPKECGQCWIRPLRKPQQATRSTSGAKLRSNGGEPGHDSCQQMKARPPYDAANRVPLQASESSMLSYPHRYRDSGGPIVIIIQLRSVPPSTIQFAAYTGIESIASHSPIDLKLLHRLAANFKQSNLVSVTAQRTSRLLERWPSGSFVLTPATAIRYERHDRKVRQLTRDEELGVGKGGRKVNIKDEYYVSIATMCTRRNDSMLIYAAPICRDWLRKTSTTGNRNASNDCPERTTAYYRILRGHGLLADSLALLADAYKYPRLASISGNMQYYRDSVLNSPATPAQSPGALRPITQTSPNQVRIESYMFLEWNHVRYMEGLPMPRNDLV